MNLGDFHQSITACKKCALHKERTQVVPGSGNPKASIMFIGEAPGKKEDELGTPFMGAAGKFLNEMLDSIELDRADVFIANTVKCRPPKNRDPEKKEIETCLPYLKKQISIIQPKIIVTLGRFSLNLFYIKTIFDYMIGFQIMETMNPGVLKRVEKRMKKDYNQEYLFTKPSQKFKGF